MPPKARIPSCHPDRPHQAKGLCHSCYNAQWYQGFDKPVRLARQRDATLKNRYGISAEDYARMFSEQGGKCALCGVPPGDKRPLHTDHSHETKRVRGLLCFQCNWFLAKIDRDPTFLLRVTAYVKED